MGHRDTTPLQPQEPRHHLLIEHLMEGEGIMVHMHNMGWDNHNGTHQSGIQQHTQKRHTGSGTTLHLGHITEE